MNEDWRRAGARPAANGAMTRTRQGHRGRDAHVAGSITIRFPPTCTRTCRSFQSHQMQRLALPGLLVSLIG